MLYPTELWARRSQLPECAALAAYLATGKWTDACWFMHNAGAERERATGNETGNRGGAADGVDG